MEGSLTRDQTLRCYCGAVHLSLSAKLDSQSLSPPMKKARLCLFNLVWVVSLLLGSSCTTRPTESQWKQDNARYKEQLKGYPDRESATQEKAHADAARKADNLRK